MNVPQGVRPISVSLRVRINRARCQGHARCAALAPELFGLDELGEAYTRRDGLVAPDLADRAHLARANCPELAIEIEDIGERT